MRRQKAGWSDLTRMGAYFHAWQDFKTLEGVRGCRYVLNNPLTDEQKEYLLQFKNIDFGYAYNKYNPEFKYSTVIIFDKKIK